MEANQRKGGNFPNAHFVSPMYYMGAYDCKFTFWYNMYHAKVSSKNDARLNILYRKNGRDTQLWTTSKSTGDKWKQAVVQLPRCPRDFRVGLTCCDFFRDNHGVSMMDDTILRMCFTFSIAFSVIILAHTS